MITGLFFLNNGVLSHSLYLSKSKGRKCQLFTYSLTKISVGIWTDISTETETLKMAETDTETEISADISAETNTDTENFRSLIATIK